MRWVIIIVALAAVGAIGFTQLKYVRCDGKFVRPGATMSEVLEYCGEPINRQSSERDRVPLGDRRSVHQGQFVVPDTPEDPIQVTTMAEQWTYELGDKHFILTFTGERQKDTFDAEEPTLLLKKIDKLKTH